MAQQVINIGAFGNDPSADTIRAAFNKANLNFTELYGWSNNVALTYNFGNLAGSGDITTAQVAQWLNEQEFAVNIYRTNTPVIFAFTRVVDGINKYYQFHFKKGFGLWGAAGGANVPGTVYGSNFFLSSVFVLTVDAVTSNPGAVIIPLGTLPGGDYLTAANASVHDFSDAGTITDDLVKTYYFSYTTGGTLYFVQFVGMPGIYGGTGTDFVPSDFVDSTNSDITPTPIPTLNQVTLQGAQSNQPIAVLNEVADKYIEIHGDHIVLKGDNGFAVKAFFLNVPNMQETNLAFSKYKLIEFKAVATADSVTLPELIGATEIFMIHGMGGPWDAQYLDDSGATLDPVIGKLTIPDFTFEANRQYEIKFK